MGITNVKTKDVVVKLIQQKLDGKLLPSVFLAKVGTRNGNRTITKDLWCKYHP